MIRQAETVSKVVILAIMEHISAIRRVLMAV
mgnify:CR=1 FL=1